jgi:hypothetical protein
MMGGSQVRARTKALEALQVAMQIERDGYAFYTETGFWFSDQEFSLEIRD